jgi:hypothetical protein
MSEIASNLAAPKRRLRRTIVMAVLLVLFSGIIWGYWTLTDSSRVKGMAEGYLSEMLGGPVTVGSASLSVFEGLQLKDVNVYVDSNGRPDSLVFTASRLLVKTDLRALIRGRLEARQILALAPHVYIWEHMESGEWNYSRMAPKPRQNQEAASPARPMRLPEVLLRGGLVEYRRQAHGKSEQAHFLAVDGQLTPGPLVHQYIFDLKSRSPVQPKGPRLRGTLDMHQRMVAAWVPAAGETAVPFLENFEFDQTMRAMLPAQVEEWWERHQLAGGITITHFSYTPTKAGEPPNFRVEVELDHVRMAIPPEELMGQEDYEKQRRRRFGFPVTGLPGSIYTGRFASMERIAQPRAIAMHNVSGRFVFTPDSIRFCNVSGRIEQNLLMFSGIVEGYSPESPMSVRLVANDVLIPANPRYLSSLPKDIRKVHSEFHPSGRATVAADLFRVKAHDPLQASLEMHVTDGAFTFHEFVYPLRGASGTVRYGKDPVTHWDRLDIIGVRGLGIEGTANENTVVKMDGWISPLYNSSVDFTISGRNATLDRHVRAAMERPLRERVGGFDSSADVPLQAHGDFEARVFRKFGLPDKAVVEVDIALDRAQGAYAPFPYAVRNASGKVLIRPRYVDIKDFTATSGQSTLAIDGRVSFGPGRPIDPQLTISARNIPIDDELRNALATDQREWLNKAGVGGKIDVDGRVFSAKPSTSAEPDIDWDMRVKLRDGVIWPVENTFAVTDAVADTHLTRSKLDILSAKGKRGQAVVTGSGAIAWPDGQPRLSLDFQAADLLLDKTLYALIPQGGKKSWDGLNPSGAINLHVKYENDPTPAGNDRFDVTIEPREVSVKPASLPWQMDKLAGQIAITPGRIALKDVTARHGAAVLKFSGVGVDQQGQTAWTIAAAGDKISVDDDLRKALPEAMGSLVKSIKLEGVIGFDCPKFTYRTADVASAGKPGGNTDVELQGRVSLVDSSLDIGVGLTHVNGAIDFSAAVHNGELDWLSAKIDAPSLLLAERSMKDLRSSLVKPAGRGFYQFADLRAKLAGGELAGQIDLETPKDGPSRYALAAVLRGCDVRQLTGESEVRIRGSVTGSIAMEGNWGDSLHRRGRGDIQVQGNDLYQIPVVLGLIQITNLSLPIKTPFTEASTQYFVDGQKVTFSQIELRAPSMVMQGSGTLDFGTHKLALVLTTDNPDWPKIPIIGALIDGAKRELFQIHVRGTIQEPLLKARSMNTFQTTIDEVFKAPAHATTRPFKKEKR